jgi:hypothetical protein
MSKTQLARELGISQPYVRKLELQGLVVVRNGSVDRARTLELLHAHWCPSMEWWARPVGAMGQELRRRWQAADQALADLLA